MQEIEGPKCYVIRQSRYNGAPVEVELDATELSEARLLEIGQKLCPECPAYHGNVLKKEGLGGPFICGSFDDHNDKTQVALDVPQGRDTRGNYNKFMQEALCYPVRASRLKERKEGRS